MKLGFYSHAALENYGGGEVTLLLLANHFARLGWEVRIRSESAYAGPRRLSPEEVRHQLEPSVDYGPMPFGDRKWEGFPSIWRSTLPPTEALADDTVSVFLLPTVPDRRYLSRLLSEGRRAVFLLHALTVDQPFPLRWGIVRDELIHRLSLWGLRGMPGAPGLVYEVLNDRSAALLRWHGVPASQVRLIPTGIDFGRYAVGDDGGRFRIAFVGRIHDPWKGIDRLRRTIRRTLQRADAPVEFVIMGSGPGAEALRTWTGPMPSVRYLGFVPFEEKVRELSACSLLLSTSGSEPYGLTTLEGFASGLPLVATPTAGSSYLVRQGPGFGAIASYSPDALARALLRYRRAWADDPAGYARSRAELRGRSKELFDLPRMFERYEACLRDVCGGR
jgi:glycosyltransferase involved in cell wall biosynthesis